MDTDNGNITLVGLPDKPHAISALSLLLKRRSLSGSLIGGISETQEMPEFCGKHNITTDVEVIPIQKLNEAHDRLSREDVKYRFPFHIDMASYTYPNISCFEDHFQISSSALWDLRFSLFIYIRYIRHYIAVSKLQCPDLSTLSICISYSFDSSA